MPIDDADRPDQAHDVQHPGQQQRAASSSRADHQTSPRSAPRWRRARTGTTRRPRCAAGRPAAPCGATASLTRVDATVSATRASDVAHDRRRPSGPASPGRRRSGSSASARCRAGRTASAGRPAAWARRVPRMSRSHHLTANRVVERVSSAVVEHVERRQRPARARRARPARPGRRPNGGAAAATSARRARRADQPAGLPDASGAAYRRRLADRRVGAGDGRRPRPAAGPTGGDRGIDRRRRRRRRARSLRRGQSALRSRGGVVVGHALDLGPEHPQRPAGRACHVGQLLPAEEEQARRRSAAGSDVPGRTAPRPTSFGELGASRVAAPAPAYAQVTPAVAENGASAAARSALTRAVTTRAGLDVADLEHLADRVHPGQQVAPGVGQQHLDLDVGPRQAGLDDLVQLRRCRRRCGPRRTARSGARGAAGPASPRRPRRSC